MPENPLFLIEADFKEVLQILKGVAYKVYLYGSRARGDFKKFSDIDLYIAENIPDEMLASLKEAFEDSNVPVKVDILMPKSCSVDFLRLIRPNMKLLKEGRF